MSQMSIDRQITEELMYEHLPLILMALEDAISWRNENGNDEDAEAYARLQAQLEEWALDG